MTSHPLHELRRVVANTPAHEFHQGTWFQQFFNAEGNLCGTVGCTLGNMARDQYFMAKGLKLIPTRQEPLPISFRTQDILEDLLPTPARTMRVFEIELHNQHGGYVASDVEAGARVLSITEAEAFSLFHGNREFGGEEGKRLQLEVIDRLINKYNPEGSNDATSHAPSAD